MHQGGVAGGRGAEPDEEGGGGGGVGGGDGEGERGVDGSYAGAGIHNYT